MPMFNNKKWSDAMTGAMMERANETQVGAARTENLKEAAAKARYKRKATKPAFRNYIKGAGQ